MPKELSEEEFVREQVAVYKDLRPCFEALRAVIVATLRKGDKNVSEMGIIDGRVKAVASFAEKCLRKRHKYRQPAWQLTDLCGVRVIVKSKDQIEPVCRFIQEHFDTEENEDTAERLNDMEFGYQSVHFIASLRKEASYPTSDLELPEELFKRRNDDEAEKTGLPIGPVYKAEIQVRTLLQHAWSVIVHDNLYKTDLKNRPRHLLRESGRIAALLEDADEAFLRLLMERKSIAPIMAPT